MRQSIAVLSAILMLTTSCRFFSNTKGAHNGKAVAVAYDEELTTDEISGLKEITLSHADSLAIISHYAQNWAREKAVLKKAKEHLSLAKKKDIEERVKNYEASLLVYEYENELVRQKFDTIVPKQVLEKYYKDNIQTYTLENPMVKFALAKNFDPAQAAKIKSMITNPAKFKELASYCTENLVDFSSENRWLPYYALRTKVPDSLATDAQLGKKGLLLNINRNGSSMLLYILDFKQAGESAPFEFAEEEIKTLILNERKADFIHVMQNEIFDKAVKRKKIKIYE